ncbi:MAG TPA: preprotein translocase subunit SecA [Chloroflexota bacterium]|jgi:preprotein translocase subunit SecA
MAWFTKILGDSNNKELKRLQPIVDQINALEPEFEPLTDEELAAKTEELRARYLDGEELDDLLPEAFANVREAAKRTLGQRHYDVQLMGGMVLHQGKIAEMRTGEGKTLAATLPAYLNALTGEGVHLVTVNDYLARRDAGWNGRIFNMLGLTTGCLVSSGGSGDHSFLFDPDFVDDHSRDERLRHLRPCTRAEAYLTDITYGTNNEYGFDYLRDNLAQAKEQCVQRGLAYAIIDEVDNILIDEARTPLIISGQAEESPETYYTFARLVPKLQEGTDYTVDYKMRAVSLTEGGITRMEQLLGVENIYDEKNYELAHYLEQGLKAHAIFKRDKDYLVRDGKVIIVDEFTGRALEGRRFSEGLHQALEAKEGVRIERENVTQATITFQNYFRLYAKLAGMTGTAITEQEEFHKIYRLEVVAIPTNMPMVRKDLNDIVYKTEAAKFDAVVAEIKEKQTKGQPVLVGTISIEKSEVLSNMLLRAGVPHSVLNAKQHEKEALVIENAGQAGIVTIATNMAGRGTDIKLGDGVVESGGLHIVGTERHESRRIDNQLRGRSGRQGDPGSSRFFVSLEDDLMRRVGSDRVKGLLDKLGLPDDEPIENGMVSRSIESAQTKVEGWNFDSRKYLVQYDDVIAGQRAVIYADRQRILAGEDVNEIISNMIHEELTDIAQSHLSDDYADNWDVDGLLKAIQAIFPVPTQFTEEYIRAQKKEDLIQEISDEADLAYEAREEQYGVDVIRQAERFFLLSIIDRRWIQHIDAVDELREGVQLQSAGQRDPLVEFRTKASGMFSDLQATIRHEVVHVIYQFEVQVHNPQPLPPPSISIVPGGASPRQPQPAPLALASAAPPSGPAVATAEPPRAARAEGPAITRTSSGPARPPNASKLGRNDPCWCGSGKKFKQCHGGA